MIKPDISVIIPVYNAQLYIVDCIESILKQDFDSYEVIFVDDGSTDESNDICRQYADTYDNFIVIEQDNAGPDMARMNGVVHSSAQYLMFVDADDRLAEGIMRVMYDTMQEDQSDMVCSQIVRFNENGRVWADIKEAVIQKTYSGTKEIMKAYFGDRVLVGSYCAKLINRSLIDDYRLADSSLIGEDIRANLYMLEKATKVTVIPRTGYYYRWNLASISHSGYTKRHRLALDNYIAVRNELLNKKLVSEQLICGYFAEYEMAVATAMSRNRLYDKEVALKLKSDIRSHWKQIRKNKTTAFYMKICMFIYMICPKVFMILYRGIYLFTGR